MTRLLLHLHYRTVSHGTESLN